MKINVLLNFGILIILLSFNRICECVKDTYVQIDSDNLNRNTPTSPNNQDVGLFESIQEGLYGNTVLITRTTRYCSKLNEQERIFSYFFEKKIRKLGKKYKSVINMYQTIEQVCHDLYHNNGDTRLFLNFISRRLRMTVNSRQLLRDLIGLLETITSLNTLNMAVFDENELSIDISRHGFCKVTNLANFYISLHISNVLIKQNVLGVSVQSICQIVTNHLNHNERIDVILSNIKYQEENRNIIKSTIDECISFAVKQILLVSPTVYLGYLKEYIGKLEPDEKPTYDLFSKDVLKYDDLDMFKTTSKSRVIGSVFPIPEIPEAPILPKGQQTEFSTGFGLFRGDPDHTKSLKSKYELYGTLSPTPLPDKYTSRAYIREFKTINKPLGYDEEFFYEDVKTPTIRYFAKPSEYEYAFMKAQEKENKKEKVKEKEKEKEKEKDSKSKPRGYYDITRLGKSTEFYSDEDRSLVSEDDASLLSDTSETLEDNTPLLDYLHKPRISKSRREKKILYETEYGKPLHPSISKRKSTKFVEQSDVEVSDTVESIKYPSETTTSDDSELSTVDIAEQIKTDDLVHISIEEATKEISIRCIQLSQPQQNRALSLLKVLRYLNNGNTPGWFVTPFCRAVYYAEKNACYELKTVEILPKLGSTCFDVLRKAPFIYGNPDLEKYTQQLCFAYYKRKISSICDTSEVKPKKIKDSLKKQYKDDQ